jgi:hypothetical protein
VSVSTGWPHIETQPNSKNYHAKEVTLFASHLVFAPPNSAIAADIRYGVANINLGAWQQPLVWPICVRNPKSWCYKKPIRM